MKARCYFRIYGSRFDAVAFAKLALPYIGGTSVTTRSAIAGAEKTAIWQSDNVNVVSDTGEAELLSAARSMQRLLEHVPLSETVQRDLVVARQPLRPSDLCGIYLTAELLQILASVRAGIDYDVVARLRL